MRKGAEAERTLKLARKHAALEDAQRFAALAVTYCTPECREAVTLAVCELGENLIKYSGNQDELHAGTIGVSCDGDSVRVRAINQVTSVEDAQRVRELVEKITRSGVAVRDLYRARLQQLFDNPNAPRTQLGLLRMAFEGGFRLSCSFDHSELQIVAERTCAGAS
ncbi:MAG TPA: DUF6272 family protein [Polyangiaceae bacterium]|nr:DUF6272 family protein [Polyangiaceae bacterium]